MLFHNNHLNFERYNEFLLISFYLQYILYLLIHLYLEYVFFHNQYNLNHINFACKCILRHLLLHDISIHHWNQWNYLRIFLFCFVSCLFVTAAISIFFVLVIVFVFVFIFLVLLVLILVAMMLARRISNLSKICSYK